MCLRFSNTFKHWLVQYNNIKEKHDTNCVQYSMNERSGFRSMRHFFFFVASSTERETKEESADGFIGRGGDRSKK